MTTRPTGEQWTIPPLKLVRSKKRHVCLLCGKPIPEGEKCWRKRLSEPDDLLVIGYEHINCINERRPS